MYGIYKEEHIGLRITRPEIVDWCENDKIVDPSCITFTKEQFFPLYLSVNKLVCENGVFEYSDGYGEKIINFSVNVEHCPTNVNFWHCQVKVHDKEIFEELDRKSYKKGRYRRLAKHILENQFLNAIIKKQDITIA